MPLKIAAEDRKLLAVVAVMLAVGLLLVGYAMYYDGGSGGVPSSYSTNNSGTKAAYLLLEELGFAPQRWTEDPRNLANAPTGTLILAEPRPGDEREAEAVRAFVNKGGRAVITGPGAMLFFPGLRTVQGTPHFQWKTYRPAEPSDLTRGIEEISMAPTTYFDASRGEAPFVDGDERPVGRIRHGAGEVIWWASTDPMTNSAIREKDNVQLLLNSVGERDRPVYWDEYFHTGGRTVVDSILASPLRWALYQGLLIVAVVAFSYSRRFGPLRASVATSRAAPMEYVETLAALYNKSRAAHIAVEVVYERLRGALQRRYGVRTDAPVEQVAQIIAHTLRQQDVSRITATLREIESSRNDPGFPIRRAGALVRTMHEWISKVKQ